MVKFILTFSMVVTLGIPIILFQQGRGKKKTKTKKKKMIMMEEEEQE